MTVRPTSRFGSPGLALVAPLLSARRYTPRAAGTCISSEVRKGRI